MNGRYVHVSSSWREEKERHIYSLNQCVSTRNKHLYNIYMNFFEFFFPFIFLFCSKEGWFVLKGFHCNKKYLTRVPVLEGNKIKSLLLSFQNKSSTLDGQSLMKTETQHKGHVHPAVCSIITNLPTLICIYLSPIYTANRS